jgi:hypothetical protein
MKLLLRSLLALPMLLLPLHSHAGSVEFASAEVKVEASPSDSEVPVNFKFKVTGDTPLKISDLEITCKCLHASVEKNEYQPGEEGEVKTIMEVGQFEGETAKSVMFVSNDPKQPRLQLTAVVNIPKLIEFTPQMTTWTVGDKPEAKTVQIKVLYKDPITILKISSTRPNMTPDIKVIKSGREYELTLTPASTASPELGLITIETDCKIAKYAKRQIFFNIVRPRNAPEKKTAD